MKYIMMLRMSFVSREASLKFFMQNLYHRAQLLLWSVYVLEVVNSPFRGESDDPLLNLELWKWYPEDQGSRKCRFQICSDSKQALQHILYISTWRLSAFSQSECDVLVLLPQCHCATFIQNNGGDVHALLNNSVR